MLENTSKLGEVDGKVKYIGQVGAEKHVDVINARTLLIDLFVFLKSVCKSKNTRKRTGLSSSLRNIDSHTGPSLLKTTFKFVQVYIVHKYSIMCRHMVPCIAKFAMYVLKETN